MWRYITPNHCVYIRIMTYLPNSRQISCQKEKWENIGSCKKQAISADMHHSCDVLIWSLSLYSSESSQWHITADMRDTRQKGTYVSDSRLIPHIVCNLIRQQLSWLIWKMQGSSPVLFALYWQSNLSRRWYKTAITNTTTASLHP